MQTFASLINRLKPIPFQKENQTSAFLKSQGRIEIKHLFSWLLQNNLLGVKVLFEIQKLRLTPRLFYFQQHFSTSEVILQQTQ